MGLTLEHIHRATNNLGRLMPAKPNKKSTREYSLKETIFLMAPKLSGMKQEGFTTNELTRALESEGIVIKGPTLTRYLLEYQKLQGEETVAKSDQAPTKSKADSGKRSVKKNKADGTKDAASLSAPESAETPDLSRDKSAKTESSESETI